MKKLHWSTPDSPCLLCGVPVTPAGWVGGVIQNDDDQWHKLHKGHLWQHVANWEAPLGTIWIAGELLTATPIFPPRGWAGKSRDEIWREMTADERGVVRIESESHALANSWVLTLCDDGGMGITDENGEGIFLSAPDPALVLALQNAQVLAAAVGE